MRGPGILLLQRALAKFEAHPKRNSAFLLILALGLLFVGNPIALTLAVTCVAQVALRWSVLLALKITNPIQKLTDYLDLLGKGHAFWRSVSSVGLLESLQSFQYSTLGHLTGVGHGILDEDSERQHAERYAMLEAREHQKPQKLLEQYLNFTHLTPAISLAIFTSTLFMGTAVALYLMAGPVGLALAAGCVAMVATSWGVYFGLRMTMPLALIAEQIHHVTYELTDTLKRLKSPIYNFRSSLWAQVAGIADNPVNVLPTTNPFSGWMRKDNLAQLLKKETWLNIGAQVKDNLAQADFLWFARRWIGVPIAEAAVRFTQAVAVDEPPPEAFNEPVVEEETPQQIEDEDSTASARAMQEIDERVAQQKQVAEQLLLSRLIKGIVGSGVLCALAVGFFTLGTPLAIAVGVSSLSIVVLGWSTFFTVRTTQFMENFANAMFALTGEVSEVLGLLNNTVENFKNSFWGRLWGISNHSLITDVTLLATRLGGMLKEAYTENPTKFDALKATLAAQQPQFIHWAWGIVGAAGVLGLAAGLFLIGGPLALAMSVGCVTTVVLGGMVFIGLRLTAPFQHLHDLIQCLTHGAGDIIQTGHQAAKNVQHGYLGRLFGLSDRAWWQVRLVALNTPEKNTSLNPNVQLVLGILASAGTMSVATYFYLAIAGTIGVTLGVAGVTAVGLSWALFFGLRVISPLHALAAMPERVLTELEDIVNTFSSMANNLRNSRLGIFLGIADRNWYTLIGDSFAASAILETLGFLFNGFLGTLLLGDWQDLPNIFPSLRTGVLQGLPLVPNGAQRLTELQNSQVGSSLGFTPPTLWRRIKNKGIAITQAVINPVLLQRGLGIAALSLLAGLSVAFATSSIGLMIVSGTCATLVVAGVGMAAAHYVIRPFFNIVYRVINLLEAAGVYLLGVTHRIFHNLKEGRIVAALLMFHAPQHPVALEIPNRSRGSLLKIMGASLISAVLTGVFIVLCTNSGILLALGLSSGLAAFLGWGIVLGLSIAAPLETALAASVRVLQGIRLLRHTLRENPSLCEAVFQFKNIVLIIHHLVKAAINWFLKKTGLYIIQRVFLFVISRAYFLVNAVFRTIQLMINQAMQIINKGVQTHPAHTIASNLNFAWMKVIKAASLVVSGFAVTFYAGILVKTATLALLGGSGFIAGTLAFLVGMAVFGFVGVKLARPMFLKVKTLLQGDGDRPEHLLDLLRPISEELQALKEELLNEECYVDAVETADWVVPVPEILIAPPAQAVLASSVSDADCEEEFFDAEENPSVDLNEEVRSTSSLSSEDERALSP